MNCNGTAWLHVYMYNYDDSKNLTRCLDVVHVDYELCVLFKFKCEDISLGECNLQKTIFGMHAEVNEGY